MRGAVDPSLEEAIEAAARYLLHRPFEVVGARLLEAPVVVEPAQAAEERLVADQPAQHVQHQRALVVDQRPIDAQVALDVAEPVAEMHRPLVGFRERPAPELPQHVQEHAVAPRLLRPERREVLREALAEPLLVVVLPADGLSPPLVRQLVGDEEVGEVVERRRVAAPGDVRVGLRIVQQREVAGAVTARRFGLHQPDRHRRERRLAQQRREIGQDVLRLRRRSDGRAPAAAGGFRPRPPPTRCRSPGAPPSTLTMRSSVRTSRAMATAR